MKEPGFILETARLRLRKFTLDDVDDMHRINCDPEVVRYTHDGGILTREEVERRIRENVLEDYRKHGYGRWAVIYKANGKVIGFAGLKYLDELKGVDVGYRFDRAYWGMGIATEAAQAAVDFGFRQLDMSRIIGLTLPENKASIRVLEKVGMTFEKTIDVDGIQAACYAMNAPC